MIRPTRIAVTHGDPNGIGPEVVLKSLTRARLSRYVETVLVGSPKVFRLHAERMGLGERALDSVEIVDPVPGSRAAVQFGEITQQAGRLAMKAVEKATDMALLGKVEALVTAPISKEAISLAGFDVPGHTEFIARRAKSNAYAMMLVADALRIGLVTGHIAIWDVPKRITEKAVVDSIQVMVRSLKRDFGITKPKIAVLGLNPHAGDGGVLGREEGKAIAPAIEDCRRRGTLAFGPFAADGFFGVGSWRNYDATLAMYHDQGLVAFKALAFESGVNFTAGLPIVRTSPDHGTAFNIAGKNAASEGSMCSAMLLARDIVRQRSA